MSRGGAPDRAVGHQAQVPPPAGEAASVAAAMVLPFTKETALAKVQAAGDAIKAFLRREWAHEFDDRLMKELWAFTGNRISVRFEYEWHDATDQWFRTHGNEHWEFDEQGLMSRRDMSANDIPIAEHERRLR